MSNDQIIDETIDKAMILAYKRVLALPEMQHEKVEYLGEGVSTEMLKIQYRLLGKNSLRIGLEKAITEMMNDR